MTWKWLVFWHTPGNGDAKHATAQAAEELEKAQQQTQRVDRADRYGRELTNHSDWFTRDMERALRIRRGSA